VRLWLLPLAVLALLVAGCGSHAPSGKTRLTLFTWTPPDELALNQRLIKQFEAAHPQLQVQLVNEPSQRSMVKLQGMIAAGKPPDVMSIHGAYFVPFADKGALLDLEPFIRQDREFAISDFYPGLLELCRFRGRFYSLPRYASVYVLFYNRDLFDRAGVPYPDDSWTWDTYLAAARKLTVHSPDPAQTRYGCAIDFWGARIYPWVWANQGRILDPATLTCTVDTPQCREALQFLVDLHRKWHVAPATSQADHRETREKFKAGLVAMLMSGAWDVQVFKSSPTLNWDVAPLPRKRVRASLLGTENYGIAAATQHPREAWALMSFLLSRQTQTLMATALEKQPSRRSVATGPYLAQQVGYRRRVFVDAVSYGLMAPNLPDWDRVGDLLQEQLDLMWYGKVSVKAGTAVAARRVTEALREKR